MAGGSSFTLVVQGLSFTRDAVIRWNGADRPTTQVDGINLLAAIPASDIAAPGIAQVTVLTPPPAPPCGGGGVSNRLTFAILPRTPAVFARVSLTNFDSEANDSSGNAVLSADGRIVTFASLASNLAFGDTNGVADVFAYDRQTSSVSRISEREGAQANGASGRPSISGDGRFVALRSSADLVPGDSNGADDIFVAELDLRFRFLVSVRAVRRISVASDATQANAASDLPSISGDGRFAAFASLASNLASGDTNAVSDIFVRDTCEGAPSGCTPRTSRVSVASDGTQTNGASGEGGISPDGRFVAFTSNASNLVPGDSNAAPDVFVRDTCVGAPAGCTPSTVRVSIARDASQAIGSSRVSGNLRPFNADGRFIVFESDASNLVAGDTNGVHDIFVRDTCVGAPAGCTSSTARVSVASDGTQGNGGSFGASLSADGRLVAFESLASNLVAGDTNGFEDIFVHDRLTSQTVRVSVASAGTQANNHSFLPTLSADGRLVAFESLASNLVAGDTNAAKDIFVAASGLVSAPVILTTSLPTGIVGAPYSVILLADGGIPPYAWNLASGSALPPGLSLNAATGQISGRPTTAGTFNFTVQLTDSANPAQTDTQPLSITIN